MTSLGFSDYTESNNDSTRNGNGNGNGNSKIYNRRNGTNNGNRTLKIPRNTDVAPERGLLQSPNGSISGITNENGNNDGVVQQAGKKIKQIKDYIENIHRKGGEDSDEDADSDNILPSYPAQGMGVYATNVTHSGIVRSGSSNTPSTAAGTESIIRKTTQMNSLNPGSSYSSTLLEGMNSSTMPPPHSPYFEKLTGIASVPKKDGAVARSDQSDSFSGSNAKTSTYASQYYEQFVPYAESLAGQLANGGSASGTAISGTNAALIEKLNYIIHMLEDKKEEKTGHVIEELVLYCFLGVFIIFIVDTFTRAASGSGGGGGGGGRAGGFSMFGGRRLAHSAVYRR
jgi:hypothetical protein